MDQADPRPWYFRDIFIIILVLGVLALALPLVWRSPYYSRRNKILITLVTLILTGVTWVVTASALQHLNDYYTLSF